MTVDARNLDCTSSEQTPLKPSGDIVETLQAKLKEWWSFDERQRHTHSWHTRTDFIYQELPKILAPFAAEIERLRREVESFRETLRIERDCRLNETRLKDQYRSRALTAESALAGAMERAAEIVDDKAAAIIERAREFSPEGLLSGFILGSADILKDAASAIRAASSDKTGSTKTAESNHPPSTPNTRTE